MANFQRKLASILEQVPTRIVLPIAPQVERMPAPIRIYDDPFLPFGRAVIKATRDLVCGYLFDFAAYLAIGAAGAVALERTVAYVAGERLTILHGPFSGDGYVILLDEGSFNVDCVTLANMVDLPSYRQRPDRTGIVVDGVGRDDVNVYSPTSGLMRFGYSNAPLHVASRELIYSSGQADFTDQIRLELQQLWNTIHDQ